MFILGAEPPEPEAGARSAVSAVGEAREVVDPEGGHAQWDVDLPESADVLERHAQVGYQVIIDCVWSLSIHLRSYLLSHVRFPFCKLVEGNLILFIQSRSVFDGCRRFGDSGI